MVQVKEAVKNAAEFVQSVLGVGNVLLEEVDTDTKDGREVWLITLSMPKRLEPEEVRFNFLDPIPREYKTFTVDRDTGEVLAMKIRELTSIQ